jgi:hypothetical protein
VTGSVAVSPKAGLISVPLRKVFGVRIFYDGFFWKDEPVW